MDTLTGAQWLAHCLRRNGVEHVFFVTGSPLNLWPALEAEGTRLILARSEKGAAYMADGYARVRGQPGVCLAQQGPGAANLAAGVAEPWMGSSPVVAITHDRGPALAQKNLYQELDQMALFAPLTKFNFQIGHLDRVADAVRNALHIATTGNPGPVHLNFLDAVALGTTEPAHNSVPSVEHHTPAARTAPDPDSVRAACQALLAAERPVLVAGHGAVLSGAWAEVQALTEHLVIPVLTSLSGKGAIPESHPLAVGVAGMYSRLCANEVLGEADLVFFVGCRTGSMVTDGFRLPAAGTRVIHLDIDPEQIGRNYPTQYGLVADARLGLQACLEQLQAGPRSDAHQAWAADVQRRVKDWQARASAALQSDQVPIHPARAIHEFRACLAPDDLIVADTGYMGAWVGALFETRAAGRTVIRAAGSLGWALPAAVGAKLAAPNRRVLAVTGDGGAGYHLMELETAVRCQIPVVVALLNNQSLAFEYHILKHLQKGTVAAASDYVPVNYARLAQELGAFGCRVEQPGDLQPALAAAFAAGTPALVEIMIDKEAIAPVTMYDSVLARQL